MSAAHAVASREYEVVVTWTSPVWVHRTSVKCHLLILRLILRWQQLLVLRFYTSLWKMILSKLFLNWRLEWSSGFSFLWSFWSTEFMNKLFFNFSTGFKIFLSFSELLCFLLECNSVCFLNFWSMLTICFEDKDTELTTFQNLLIPRGLVSKMPLSLLTILPSSELLYLPKE